MRRSVCGRTCGVAVDKKLVAESLAGPSTTRLDISPRPPPPEAAGGETRRSRRVEPAKTAVQTATIVGRVRGVERVRPHGDPDSSGPGRTGWATHRDGREPVRDRDARRVRPHG